MPTSAEPDPFKSNEWINNQRVIDGMTVFQISVIGADNPVFLIRPSDPRDERPTLLMCPCCGTPFHSAEHAQRVADAWYPSRPDDSGLANLAALASSSSSDETDTAHPQTPTDPSAPEASDQPRG